MDILNVKLISSEFTIRTGILEACLEAYMNLEKVAKVHET
jgi:hypothetical protein